MSSQPPVSTQLQTSEPVNPWPKPSVTYSEATAVSYLQNVRHSDWFNPEHKEARLFLLNHEYQVEMLNVIFWCLFPAVLLVLVHVVGYFRLKFNLRWRESFYTAAGNFYEIVRTKGTRAAADSCDTEAMVKFVWAYPRRVASIYHPVAFILPVKKGCIGYFRLFAEQTLPAVISVLFLCYTGVLDGLLRPLMCKKHASEDITRMIFASEVECYNRNDTLFMITCSMAALWGISVPVFCFVLLHRWRWDLPEDFEFPGQFSLVAFGYRLSCWNWEFYIFMLKAAIICSGRLITEVRTKTSVMFFISVVHVLFVMLNVPFTTRNDRKLLKAEGAFSLFFSLHAILNEFLHLSSQGSSQTLLEIQVPLLILGIMAMHVVYLFVLIRDFLQQVRDAFVESYDLKSWSDWDAQRKAGKHWGIRPILNGLVWRSYRRAQAAKPYVCFDSDMGWVTVCGSGGDKAVATDVWAAFDKQMQEGEENKGGKAPELLLSQAPTAPEDSDVSLATATQRRKFQYDLLIAVERMAVTNGTPTFSVLQLEFIIRAAFVLARRLQAKSIAHAREAASFISNPNSELADIDPLTLLMEVPPGEEGEDDDPFAEDAPKRRSVGRSSRSSKSSASPSEGEAKGGLLNRLKNSGGEQNDDPVITLFYMRQADNIRDAEIKRFEGDEAARERTMGRVGTMTRSQKIRHGIAFACKVFAKIIGIEDENGQNDVGMMNVQIPKSTREAIDVARVFINRYILGLGSEAMIRDPLWLEFFVTEMFQEHFFRRGIDMESLQLGLQALGNTSDADLDVLRNKFEEAWFEHRATVQRKISSLKGKSADKKIQANRLEMMHAQIQAERNKSKVKEAQVGTNDSWDAGNDGLAPPFWAHLPAEDDRPNLEDLRWMRMVLRAGYGCGKSGSKPRIGELAGLIRKRAEVMDALEAEANISGDDTGSSAGSRIYSDSGPSDSGSGSDYDLKTGDKSLLKIPESIAEEGPDEENQVRPAKRSSLRDAHAEKSSEAVVQLSGDAKPTDSPVRRSVLREDTPRLEAKTDSAKLIEVINDPDQDAEAAEAEGVDIKDMGRISVLGRERTPLPLQGTGSQTPSQISSEMVEQLLGGDPSAAVATERTASSAPAGADGADGAAAEAPAAEADGAPADATAQGEAAEDNKPAEAAEDGKPAEAAEDGNPEAAQKEESQEASREVSENEEHSQSEESLSRDEAKASSEMEKPRKVKKPKVKVRPSPRAPPPEKPQRA
eukprot:TRINITY_DN7302_c3_g3_i1.p1 TRINITY_DN7302_c3_g3~~TRINITY_DN7302_c3_g3_i1.p1  ORF type:complete len:1248 (-),score=218.63 TRINITY_DN7302_c3_g3_i1:318-4028(-)